MDTETKAEFNRLHKKLNELFLVSRKETWVKVSTIKELTIWNTREKIRQARDQGLIKMRKSSNGIEYLLESVNDRFFKSTITA